MELFDKLYRMILRLGDRGMFSLDWGGVAEENHETDQDSGNFLHSSTKFSDLNSINSRGQWSGMKLD